MRHTLRLLCIVAGNGAYRVDPLANPLNDAADMAATLQELGFKVILKRNATAREIWKSIREALVAVMVVLQKLRSSPVVPAT